VSYVAFEDLKPAELNDRVCAGRIIRVAGEEPGVDALYYHAAYICSGVCVFKVPMKVGDKLMAPSSSGLAAVGIGGERSRFRCYAGRYLS
jgi:hypothetical protein